MRYHWLIDQSNLNNFFIYWDKGENNNADYHTKHFPPSHHRNVRPKYILKGHHVNSQHDAAHLPALGPIQDLHARVCLFYTVQVSVGKLKIGNLPLWFSRAMHQFLNLKK